MTEIEEMKAQLDRIEKATVLAAKKVLNLEEVAFMTGFKKATIYTLTSNGEIPHYKRSGRLFFNKEDIESWLTEHKVNSNAEVNILATTAQAIKRMKATK